MDDDLTALCDRVAEALYRWTLKAAGARALIPSHEEGLRENSRARAHAVMPVFEDALAEQAEARVREYESALCWVTTCLNCARLLDASYSADARAEQAEATVVRTNALMIELADWAHQNLSGDTLHHVLSVIAQVRDCVDPNRTLRAKTPPGQSQEET